MADVFTVPDWLAADHPWLSAQPGMSPWPDAVGRVVTQLERWVKQYTTQLGVTAAGLGIGAALWGCWAHHWRTAVEVRNEPADGWQVAAEIEAGKGRRGRGQLGGNVIKDVILAHAMLAKDNTAIRRFEADYKESVVRQVGAVRRFARDDEAWWNDLLAVLVGVHREGKAGRLAAFRGLSGLTPWVVTVAVRFLSDRAPNSTGVELDVEPAGPNPGKAGLALPMLSEECLGLLTARVRAALQALDQDQRLVLKLAYVDRRPGQDIARVLGIHPGNVTRRRQDALTDLQGRLADGPGDPEAIGDCLRDLMAGGRRQDLAETLFGVLSAADAEGDR